MTFSDRRNEFFVSAAELENLDTVKILDVRFDPELGSQVEEFEREHSPGAVFVDLPSTLDGAQDGASGRFPLPDVEVLRQSLEEWGISDGSEVVVYDNRHGITAARAWWTLTWAGMRGVRVLDGGFSQWRALGLPGSGPGIPRRRCRSVRRFVVGLGGGSE